ncbi:MAG: peptidyl-prolyl cis-trans isomerase [Acidobacteria bacterium]|nr:peptidyl-prolyl cis-trans isomerase [Acidobacteriota bacterium]
MAQMTNLVREPLVHFFVLGAGIFLLATLVDESDENRPDQIVVSVGQIDRLVETWQRTWQRPPTQAELEGLVEDHIREEILYREALALGLDRDDTIIRRRLRQKMEFLPQDLVEQVEPTEEELRTYLRENADAYQVEARVSFQHIYLNLERRGTAAEGDARRLLADLEANGGPVEPLALSDPILLPHDFQSLSVSEVARLFGQEFASRLIEIAPGNWTGPLVSSYGLHLVRVGERLPARMPELSEVRKAVERDWQFMRRQELDDQFFRSLKERYVIEVQLPEWLESTRSETLQSETEIAEANQQ